MGVFAGMNSQLFVFPDARQALRLQRRNRLALGHKPTGRYPLQQFGSRLGAILPVLCRVTHGAQCYCRVHSRILRVKGVARQMSR